MKTQRTIRRTILAMAIAGLAASGSALAVGSYDIPQALEVGDGGVAVGGVAEVTGVIGTTTAVDFYSFTTKAGNHITIDIDGTHLGTNPEHDVIIYVFDGAAARNWVPVQDSTTVDAGSQQAPAVPAEFPYTLDPAATFDVTSATEGLWTVAVASNGRFVSPSGSVSGFGDSTGPYKLIVMGIPLPVATTQPIDIDIKPGIKEHSVLNPKSKGVLPVALLGAEGFNPFDVEANVENLRFGKTGDEKSFVRCLKDGRDVNADGKLDRICHFDNEKAEFVKTSTQAKVKGKANGKTVQGTGFLKVVPQKQKD